MVDIHSFTKISSFQHNDAIYIFNCAEYFAGSRTLSIILVTHDNIISRVAGRTVAIPGQLRLPRKSGGNCLQPATNNQCPL